MTQKIAIAVGVGALVLVAFIIGMVASSLKKLESDEGKHTILYEKDLKIKQVRSWSHGNLF